MDFEDIRPYSDKELPVVMKELVNEPAISQLVEKFFPQLPLDHFKTTLTGLTTVKQFQSQVISDIVALIISKTSEGLSFEGLEKLDRETPYLFISNHRDIVLDSALINYILNKEGGETARIAIGINLLSEPWITHLVKLNKSFVVKRDLPRNEMYAASMQLSHYILKSITEDGESVWIAQREGRSKDGDDRTHGGLINMLGMSKGESPSEHFKSLNIVPVAISYELDPCDTLKLPELYAKSREEAYEKQKDEDLNSMKLGITGKNGRIKISFGNPIRDIPEIKDGFTKNDLIHYLVQTIDHQIHQNYHLWPTNYIAADLLESGSAYSDHYSTEEKERFVQRMEKRLESFGDLKTEMRSLFLSIYANPLINQLADKVK